MRLFIGKRSKERLSIDSRLHSTIAPRIPSIARSGRVRSAHAGAVHGVRKMQFYIRTPARLKAGRQGAEGRRRLTCAEGFQFVEVLDDEINQAHGQGSGVLDHRSVPCAADDFQIVGAGNGEQNP